MQRPQVVPDVLLRAGSHRHVHAVHVQTHEVAKEPQRLLDEGRPPHHPQAQPLVQSRRQAQDRRNRQKSGDLQRKQDQDRAGLLNPRAADLPVVQIAVETDKEEGAVEQGVLVKGVQEEGGRDNRADQRAQLPQKLPKGPLRVQRRQLNLANLLFQRLQPPQNCHQQVLLRLQTNQKGRVLLLRQTRQR